LIALVCAAVAAFTGEARGFFLVPTIIPATALVVCVVTALIRRPFAGILLNRVSGGPPHWYDDTRFRRIYAYATWAGALISLLNAAGQAYFYLANQPVVLAAIRIAITPVFSVIDVLTIFAVRHEVAQRASAQREGAPLG
jgi:hypothetical protein